MSYDFSCKTFGEFLKINGLSIEDGIIVVVNEYQRLKKRVETLQFGDTSSSFFFNVFV